MQRVRKMVAGAVPAGIDGQGVTAAVLDTGMGRHPDLRDRAVCFRDFVGHREQIYDDSGHGTHVCGILCGSGRLSGGRFRGMAPGLRLVVGKYWTKGATAPRRPCWRGWTGCWGCASHMASGS